jgi:UrcA family protein
MITSRVFASVIGACVLASVLVAPRLTFADSVAQAPTAGVRFGDLNLDSRSDVATLFHRIQRAAGEVCQQYAPQGTLLPSAAYRSCITNALSGAVRNVDSPLLTAYYSERDDRQALHTANR